MLEDTKEEEAEIPSIPLSKLIIAALTPRAYRFISDEFFSSSLMICSCQECIVVKQGHTFPSISNSTLFKKCEEFESKIFEEMIVLSCEPLYCGTIHLKTSIIAVNAYDFQSKVANSVEPKTQIQTVVPLMSKFLQIYHCPELQSKYCTGQYLNAIILQNADSHWKNCKLRLTFSAKTFFKLFQKDETIIDLYEVNLSDLAIITEEFAKKYGLFDADFVEVKIANEKTPKKTNNSKNAIYKIKVSNRIHSVLGQIETANTLFVLSYGFWSLSLDSSALFEEDTSVIIRRYISPVKGVQNISSQSPPFADEVHVSCVISPSYNVNDSFHKLLEERFINPRLVRKNDVLYFDSKDDPGYAQYMTELSELRHPVIYFKVTQIQPCIPGCKTYLADSKHTNLYLDAPVQSYVPSLMYPVIREDSALFPPGFNDYLLQILQIIHSYIKDKDRKNQIYPSILLTGSSGCGKTSVVRAVAALSNMHFFQVNCHEICGETSGATETKIKYTIQRAQSYAPCILLMRNIEVLGKDRDGNSEDPRVGSAFREVVESLLQQSNAPFPTVLMASTSAFKLMNPDIAEMFLHRVDIGVPNEITRFNIIKSLLQNTEVQRDINLNRIAQRTAGFVLGDFYALVCEVKRTAYHRIVNYCKDALGGRSMTWKEDKYIADVGYPVISQDIEDALNSLQSSHSDSLGAPKIPDVKWEDIGGLTAVKSEILDTIQLPMQHPELFAQGLQRSGVLLYGPPGTGKTLLAKAVATECSLNFMSVKGPELINMYVGQSEENIREVFHRARNASPCVVFFDELDSLAPNRGRSGDSGGVMDRVVSQLLAELDGLQKTTDVFVIGATNRPDLLDPALLRPGRFDKLLYLGVSEDRNAQIRILKALTRKFTLHKSCDLEQVVLKCSLSMTGADFYALCSDAMLNAVKEKIDALESGEPVDQTSIPVHLEDFDKALTNLVPSVSEQELARYKLIQEQFDSDKKILELD